jgi:aldehyde:ferredoxin oxidoreductase
MLTGMVSCLFARKVYSTERLQQALTSVGLADAADRLDDLAREMQILRWRHKLACGFDPRAVKIPRRFLEVVTWKGGMDEAYLNEIKEKYAAAILDLANSAE